MKEINFAAQLEALMKDTITNNVYLENYTTLHIEDKSVHPESLMKSLKMTMKRL